MNQIDFASECIDMSVGLRQSLFKIIKSFHYGIRIIEPLFWIRLCLPVNFICCCYNLDYKRVSLKYNCTDSEKYQ